jgi:hypothetical protein
MPAPTRLGFVRLNLADPDLNVMHQNVASRHANIVRTGFTTRYGQLRQESI